MESSGGVEEDMSGPPVKSRQNFKGVLAKEKIQNQDYQQNWSGGRADEKRRGYVVMQSGYKRRKSGNS